MADKKIRLELSYPEFTQLMLFCMDNKGVPELDQLYSLLDSKLNKLIEHDLYSKYKTAPTPEQREQARQEYLDRKNIPASFRW